MQSELAQDETFQRAVVLIRDISLAPRKDPTVELSSEVMPTRLSPYLRERIVRLWKEGENISSIMTILRAEGGETTRATVRKWIYRWEERRGLEDDHRSGRPSKITLDMAVFLEQQLEEDDELTSVELQRLVTRRFDVKLTSATIRRYLRIALQWSVVRTRYSDSKPIPIPNSSRTFEQHGAYMNKMAPSTVLTRSNFHRREATFVIF